MRDKQCRVRPRRRTIVSLCVAVTLGVSSSAFVPRSPTITTIDMLRSSYCMCTTRYCAAPPQRRQVYRHAHILNTAFEWLAVERAMDEPYGKFYWMNPAASPSDDASISSQPDDEIMPLYPLSATHLPSTINHTFNNVEPRNLKMTEDLLQSKDRRFCVVLRASDTGRIASVGTVMQITDVSRDERAGIVRRFVIKCQSVGLARIVGIENPTAAKPESRLLRSTEYLKARVRSWSSQELDSSSYEDEGLVARIVDDYRIVRSLYLQGNGAGDLPPFALQHLSSALPDWNERDFATDEGFWNAVQLWQTLCYTVREQRQIILSADRNEVMIAAACEKGGPLKLPVHVEDLPPEVRYQLAEMEVQAQIDFVQLGLDPCLDFQNLLCMDGKTEQLKFLSKMISRERRRLEQLSTEPTTQSQVIEEEAPRKGAWFEGFE